MVIDQQRQEIQSLKAVYNDHENKINHLMVSPPPASPITQPASYKEVLKTGLPEITASILKEQSERQRRAKNIIIKDKRNPKESLIQPATDPTEVVNTWLTSHGLSHKDIHNSSIKVIANKTLPSPDPSPHHEGHTIIVTLPNVDNRLIAIGKIKKCIRSRAPLENIFVDLDLTPAEAQAHHALRIKRNQLNGERSESDKANFHYGIRNGKIIKLSH
jgi:hypothetical protein